MASHEFQVYQHEDGTFRSRLVDGRGKIVRFPVSPLAPELDAEDAQFFRRNVQAALAERWATFVGAYNASPDVSVVENTINFVSNPEADDGKRKRARGVIRLSTSSNNSG